MADILGEIKKLSEEFVTENFINPEKKDYLVIHNAMMLSSLKTLELLNSGGSNENNGK